jgi:NAD(P)H dehydrogenase (quinone)
MSKILVTGATGATGRKALGLLLEQGREVKALVHREDERSFEIRKLGVEVILGDYLDFDFIAKALKRVNRTYFCYPIRPGILQATNYFAQAARESNLEAIVNMSQISARREAKSRAAQDHWISEQVFDWSGVPTTHLRPTFFAEWLLSTAPNISQGRLTLPFKGKHAPIAAEDQAHVIANILNAPEGHGGKVYPLHGPENLSQEEIASQVSEALGIEVKYQYAPFDDFFKALISSKTDRQQHTAQNMYGALENNADGRNVRTFVEQHLREVSIDHDNGIFAGTNDVVRRIGGVPGTTVKEFVLKYKDAYDVPSLK